MADYFPEFFNFRSIVHELVVEVSRAENLRSPYWIGQSASILQFNAFNISFSSKVTLVSVIHTCSHRQTSVTPVTLFTIELTPCCRLGRIN